MRDCVWVRGGALESLGNWRSNSHKLAYARPFVFLPFLPVGYLKSFSASLKTKDCKAKVNVSVFCLTEKKATINEAGKDRKLIDVSFVSWKVYAVTLWSMQKRRKQLFH